MILKNATHSIVLGTVLLLCLGQNMLMEVAAIQYPDTVIFSTNTSNPFLGETFLLQCQVPSDYQFTASRTYVYFYSTLFTPTLAFYSVSRDRQDITFNYDGYFTDYKRYLAAVQQRPVTTQGNATTFEVALIANGTFGPAQFNCQLNIAELPGYKTSAQATVTAGALPPLPAPPTLASNVSTVQLNRTFTLTCLLQGEPGAFAPNRPYSVAFFSSRDGQLAKYDVDASGGSFFSGEDLQQAAVRYGARSTFPAFDIEVTERADATQNVWCELGLQWRQESLKSNMWNYRNPILNFTSTSSGDEHQGRCTVSSFLQHDEKEYQVRFYSTFGPQNENLIGYYEVKPNQRTTFQYEHVPDRWASIAHGARTTFPDYEIVIRKADGAGSTSGHSWWCALHIGPIKTPYQLVKSAAKSL